MPAVTEAAPEGVKRRAVTSIPVALHRRVQAVAEEREVLDQLAGELGNMSRSELVTHLYELELGDEEADG